MFGRRAKVGPEPVPLAALVADQEHVHGSVVAGACKAKDADKALLWKALNKEVSQGFGEVHLGRPGAVDVPDVFYPRFIAEQEKWDTEAWLRKPRPVDDATSNGVNGALQVLSHADCHTLDRFAESASLFMRRSREHGYRGGFSCLVFDHDQAYRRVKRQRAFRALVPVVSPGGTVPVAGSQVFVPEGDVVYLEMWRLLFGEAGWVPG